jgi:glutamate---cysteine ligase / carboxylate-amine ligase
VAAGATAQRAAIDEHASTFGIEEEYFLVSAQTRAALRRVPKRFLRECRRRLGDVVCAELLQSQVEVASPVFTGSAEARERMIALRRGVAAVAESMDYRLVAAGSHPLAFWQQLEPTGKPRYTKLIGDFQIIGRRNALCGLHVHAGVPAGVDRVALMNRLMPWLPVLLALSTSSPFWERRRTGLLSYRQAAYDEWPRTGIPDPFADQAEYDRFVALLVRQQAIANSTFLWWAIRPSSAFPTLELRITDCCTRIDDALAIAALFRCLVRAHIRRPELGADHGPLSRRVIDENRWRAKRFGIECSLIDEHGEVEVPFAAKLDQLRELIAEDAHALGCEDALRRLARIMAIGTSAHQQLAVYEEQRAAGGNRLQALRAVVDWLADATVATDHDEA